MGRWVEQHWQVVLLYSICLLVLLLPLWLDPWAVLPFEPAKAILVRGSAAFLGVTAFLVLSISGQVRRDFSQSLRRTWPLSVAVLLYFLTIALAGFLSHSPTQSFWGASDRHGVLTLWSQIVIFYLLILVVQSARRQEQIIRWLLLDSVPICLYGLVQAMGWDPLAWQTDSVSPVLSTLGRSNFLGAYLAILLPLGFYHLTATWARRGIVPAQVAGGLLLVSLQSLCLLLTLARAGWIAAVAGVLVFFWFVPSPGAGPRLVYRGSLLVAACVVLALLFFLGEQTGRAYLLDQGDPFSSSTTPMNGTEDEYGALRETSLARRLIIWRATWPLIVERPLLGYGPEMFTTVFNSRYPPGSLYDGTDVLVDDPHNQWLEHLMAAGVVGASAYLLLLALLLGGLILRLSRKTGEPRLFSAACLGALIAYLAQAQLNPDVIAVSLLFWILAAVSWGGNTVGK